MRISSIQLKNFRCFNDLTINLDPNLTVIVGANGTGKSSILEGIAVSLASFTSAIAQVNYLAKSSDATRKYNHINNIIDVVPQYPIVVSSSGVIDDQEVEWTRTKNTEKATTMANKGTLVDYTKKYTELLHNDPTQVILPLLVYYGTNRLWNQYIERKTDKVYENRRINGYLDCFNGAANNKLMNTWFKKMTNQQVHMYLSNQQYHYPEFDACKKVIIDCFKVMTNSTDVSLSYNFDIDQLEFVYTDSVLGKVRIPMNQLSDGYKTTLSLFADIAYRMTQLNPQLGENVIQNTPGIVLIDELDLHLHPAWQQKMIQVLRDHFPQIQFIITTHAPAVINSVSNHNLRILDNYTIKLISEQSYGKDINTILNQIMLVSDRPISITNQLNECYRLLDEGKYNEAEKIINELELLIDSTDSDLVSLRTKIKLRRLKESRV